MRLMFLVLIAFLATSCSSGYNFPLYTTQSIPAYLPYIESIETIPDIVIEGEPYDVIANVSCQLNPLVLRGGPVENWQDQSTDKWHWTENYNSMALSVSKPGEWVAVNNPWIIQPATTGDIVRSFVIKHVDSAIAGTSICQILTADSPEWGGLSVEYITPYEYGSLDHPHAVYREFEITVLPADEVAE